MVGVNKKCSIAQQVFFLKKIKEVFNHVNPVAETISSNLLF